MKSAVDRILFLLAASGLDEITIYRTLREVERIGASRMTMEVERLRRRLPEYARAYVDESFAETSSSEREYRSLVANVDKMLRVEANLTGAQAASRLATSLSRSKRPSGPIPKFSSKKGFRDWLLRLSKLVSSADLLHHAAKIRNERAHNKDSDWPLKE